MLDLTDEPCRWVWFSGEELIAGGEVPSDIELELPGARRFETRSFQLSRISDQLTKFGNGVRTEWLMRIMRNVLSIAGVEDTSAVKPIVIIPQGWVGYGCEWLKELARHCGIVLEVTLSETMCLGAVLASFSQETPEVLASIRRTGECLVCLDCCGSIRIWRFGVHYAGGQLRFQLIALRRGADAALLSFDGMAATSIVIGDGGDCRLLSRASKTDKIQCFEYRKDEGFVLARGAISITHACNRLAPGQEPLRIEEFV